MTDLACPSCSIGAHPVLTLTVCGREKGLFFCNYWMKWFFELIAEARLSQPTAKRICTCSHVRLIEQLRFVVHTETCRRLLWVVSFNGLNYGFVLQGPVPKAPLLLTWMYVWQSSVYTRAHFRSCTSNSERMRIEQIKTVYSCLFMRVHHEPEMNREASIPCPNCPSYAQQEGPVYTAVSGLFIPASSHLPNR